MKKIVLFDMDGTLTPPREKMQYDMVRRLGALQKEGFEIGILTGSDMNYLKEQCDALFDIGPVDAKSIHYLPCNGTKYFRYSHQSHPWQLIKSVDMIEEIGHDAYKTLLGRCMKLQRECINENLSLEYTGNFFDYRGSVLNWCPIGRSSSKQQRLRFVEFDKQTNYRLNKLTELRKEAKVYDFGGVVFALGGESSFDIYPSGWDKTFALKYFKDYEVYFVGDRCMPNGNDHTVYLACKQRGYKTTGPKNTVAIIDQIILENKS